MCSLLGQSLVILTPAPRTPMIGRILIILRSSPESGLGALGFYRPAAFFRCFLSNILYGWTW